MSSNNAATLVANDGRSWPLQEGAQLSIGRASANDITIKDPTVSQKHTVITVRDGQIVVNDLGSANGTDINGRCLAKLQSTQTRSDAADRRRHL